MADCDTRVCSQCLRRKPEDQFQDETEVDCIACNRAKPREEVVNPPSKPPAPTIDNDSGSKSRRRLSSTGRIEQQCLICHFYKPLYKFDPDPADRLNDGIARRCKYCMPFHLMGKAGVYKQAMQKQPKPARRQSRSASRNRPKKKHRRKLSGKSPDIDISAKSGIGE